MFQEALIEQKKREIQEKMAAAKKKQEMEALNSILKKGTQQVKG